MHVSKNRFKMQQTIGLQVREYVFEGVNNFKYLGTNLSNINDNHEEIKKYITSGNKCF